MNGEILTALFGMSWQYDDGGVWNYRAYSGPMKARRTTCPHCGEDLGGNRFDCPHCGCDLGTWDEHFEKARRLVPAIVLGLVWAVFMLALLLGCGDPSSDQSSRQPIGPALRAEPVCATRP